MSAKQGKVTDPCFRMATITYRGDTIYTHPGTDIHTEEKKKKQSTHPNRA